MDFWLKLIDDHSSSGWTTMAGIFLLMLLGGYAIVALNAERLPRWLRPPQPASLRSRIALLVMLSTILPGTALLLILAGRSEQGLVPGLGWLLATTLICLCLGVAVADSISAALRDLGREIRNFDADSDRQSGATPRLAPEEIVTLFQDLARMLSQQRAAQAQLQRSVRQGERLRRELIAILESRETEIRDHARELTQANSRLETQCRTDVLTGVANRRGLAEFLDRAWRAALREQHPLSLLLVDLDNFHAYNERHGDAKGDICLQAVANAVSHIAARGTDLVARYGGEEFLVVLGNTPLEGALRVAEQVRASIEGLAIPHGGQAGNPFVSVSVGVTSSVPVRGSQADATLEAVERALQAARQQGRNRVAYSSIARTGLFQSLCITSDTGQRPS